MRICFGEGTEDDHQHDTLNRAKKWKLGFQPAMSSMHLDMGETSQPDENPVWDSGKN